MNPEIIKAYLVKLGVQVDTAAFDKMKSLLADVEKAMGANAQAVGMQMAKGAGMAVAALATIDLAIAKTIEKVAEADMKYQLLAQSMFMNVDAAKAYKMATDTLGASLHQIAWNAELQAQYFELVKDVNDIKIPQEARDMFKQVRSIGFEFKRAKMLSTEFITWTAFELTKLNKGPMYDFHTFMKEWNENFKTNIKEWSRNVAEFLQPFIQVIKSLWEFIKYIGTGLKDIWNSLKGIGKDLSPIQKELTAIAIAAAVFFMGGSFIKGLVGIAAALILIDDYMTFKKGGESLKELIPLWEKLEFVIDGIALAAGAAAIAMDHYWNAANDKYKDLSFGDDIMRWEQHFSSYSEKKAAKIKSLREGNKAARLAESDGSGTLLERISYAEGTSDEKAKERGFASGYDVPFGYGAYGGKPAKPATEMTIAEIEAHMKKMLADPTNVMRSSGMGKYQFMQSTLFGKSGLLAQQGVSKDAIFDAALQDKLAVALIAKETASFKEGKMSPAAYQNVIAGRWAGVPRSDTGLSTYGQRTGISSNEIAQTIRGMMNPKGDGLQTPLVASSLGGPNIVNNNSNMSVVVNGLTPENAHNLKAEFEAATKRAMVDMAKIQAMKTQATGP